MNRVWTEERSWNLARRKIYLRAKKRGACLVYTGFKNDHGYGVIAINKKKMLAHRVSFTISKGEIPEGMCILHSCDNPPCINPDHLRVGTKKENCDDMWERGRNSNALAYKRKLFTVCGRGHKLSGSNLILRKDGRRNCRKCSIIFKRNYRERIRSRHGKEASSPPRP